MQKRIYITVDLPDAIKESFRKEEGRWRNLNVFWTGFSHLHLTLDYLGTVDKEGLKQIIDALDDITEGMRNFDIRLDRITLGPDEKDPKMFWGRIYEDGAVKGFLNAFHSRLAEKGFELKEKSFVPHIMLASAKGNQLKGKQTNVHLKGKFNVDSLNLYSSQTYGKGSVKFKLIGTFPLQK